MAHRVISGTPPVPQFTTVYRPGGVVDEALIVSKTVAGLGGMEIAVGKVTTVSPDGVVVEEKTILPANPQVPVIVLVTLAVRNPAARLIVTFEGLAVMVKLGVHVGLPVTMKLRLCTSISSGSMGGVIGTLTMVEVPFMLVGRVMVVVPTAQVKSVPGIPGRGPLRHESCTNIWYSLNWVVVPPTVVTLRITATMLLVLRFMLQEDERIWSSGAGTNT